MEWHIDAWDPSGGRAFASQRTQNRDLSEADERRGPTVYIGPPGFQPELLANVAIAIAACHSASFDPRLPLRDGDELAFPTADSVADFVRRAFVGSSRGRGGGGDGGVVDGGGPQGPPEGEGGEAPALPGLVNYLERWNVEKNVARAPDGYEPVEFLGHANNEFFGVARQRPIANVEDGALQTLGAVLANFPKGANDAQLEQWQSAASSLDAALTELGLWRSWLVGGGARLDRANQYLFPAIQALLRELQIRTEDATMAARHVLSWPSFVNSTDSSIDEFLYRHLRYWHHYSGIGYVSGSVPPTERYEALFGWPLLSYARTFLAARNVGQLLVTFVSSPGEFVNKPYGVLDVVGFAAAFLGSRVEDRTDAAWRERSAAAWLGRSMPKYSFGKDGEYAIRNSSSTPLMHAAGVGA